MDLLKELSNKDIGEQNKKVKYELRKAARTVLFNKNKVALLFVSKYGYHKLPGGGIEENETIKEGLKREIVEETACNTKIKNELGIIIEYRDDVNELQISYCFIAEVIKILKTNLFTDEEKEEGYELQWVSLDEAIKLIEKEKPSNYIGKFIVKRDLIFLKKAKDLINQ